MSSNDEPALSPENERRFRAICKRFRLAVWSGQQSGTSGRITCDAEMDQGAIRLRNRLLQSEQFDAVERR